MGPPREHDPEAHAMSEGTYYRIVQPARADVLCKLSAPAELVTCPSNSMHQRAGRDIADPSVTSMPRKRFARSHFCYSWSWRYLATEGLIEALQKEGITGFSAGPLSASAAVSE